MCSEVHVDVRFRLMGNKLFGDALLAPLNEVYDCGAKISFVSLGALDQCSSVPTSKSFMIGVSHRFLYTHILLDLKWH